MADAPQSPAAAGARRLILGSASPRRREIMLAAGLDFEVAPGGADETCPLTDGRAVAAEVARRKAVEVWRKTSGPRLVIGADTVVAAPLDRGGEVLGKPSDADDARRMLRLLSGATHEVHTGIALAWTDGPDEPGCAVRVVSTHVAFRDLGPGEVDAYIASGEPFDKAGAYGIQGGASVFVQRVVGSYHNVVGLPIDELLEMLASARA
ncbi:MAG: Maf family protein [Armatimonadetes bacterium]|nr:Maf family protein [Armatimonadota bacterium]